jgi:hypothetical protein
MSTTRRNGATNAYREAALVALVRGDLRKLCPDHDGQGFETVMAKAEASTVPPVPVPLYSVAVKVTGYGVRSLGFAATM